MLPDLLCRAVYADGNICLDILQKQWSPIYDVTSILTSIQVCEHKKQLRLAELTLRVVLCAALQSLLTDPNPDSPANSEAAKMFMENKAEYTKRVLRCVEESWM